MVVGNGDIASVITDQPNKVFFASGVSNSSCTDWTQFQRERRLLLQQSKFSHLVYFSSLSIYYNPHNRYAQHKLFMERLVKDSFPLCTIIRLGNITWGSNPHTLINYLKKRIENKEPYTIQDVYRYVIDKEEFCHWLELIPDYTNEINIPGRRMKVSDIEYCIKNNQPIK